VRVEPAPPPRRPPLGPLPVNGLAALLGLAFLAASLLRRPPGPAPPAAVEKQPPSAEQETARVAEQLAADLEAVAQEQALDSPAPAPAADEERPLSAERDTARVAEQLSSDLEAVAQEQALDSPAPPPAACAPATASASSSALCSVTSMVRPSAAMCSPVLDSARQAPCPVLLDLHGAALCCECALLC